ncbi:MAG: RNA polymerase sigma factor [Verrucomicrobiales bacterium]
MSDWRWGLISTVLQVMGDDGFYTTQWTQVLSARGDSEGARDALGELTERYYAPLVAFLRKEGRGEDAARELAHGFFAWLLSRDALERLERGRGRFRSYLLGALKHYLSHERERAGRLKRGGGAAHLAIGPETDTSPGIDPADALTLPPDREFDRQWALHVLREAMAALGSEWEAAGRGEEFAALRPFLDGDAPHGALAELAADCGKNENTLRSSLHRLRRAFRDQVKAQIAPTLESGDDVAGEMEILYEALGA